MAIYLDLPKLDEERRAKNFGWVYGVTTHPSLMEKAGVEPEVALRGLVELEFHQVYYQLVSGDPESMLLEAHEPTELAGSQPEVHERPGGLPPGRRAAYHRPI